MAVARVCSAKAFLGDRCGASVFAAVLLPTVAKRGTGTRPSYDPALCDSDGDGLADLEETGAEDFIRRGKLTPEEARHVFGPLPGTDGGTATNAIMKAP